MLVSTSVFDIHGFIFLSHRIVSPISSLLDPLSQAHGLPFLGHLSEGTDIKALNAVDGVLLHLPLGHLKTFGSVGRLAGSDLINIKGLDLRPDDLDILGGRSFGLLSGLRCQSLGGMRGLGQSILGPIACCCWGLIVTGGLFQGRGAEDCDGLLCIDNRSVALCFGLLMCLDSLVFGFHHSISPHLPLGRLGRIGGLSMNNILGPPGFHGTMTSICWDLDGRDGLFKG